MKTSSRFVSAASLIFGIAIATATAAIAQGMQGGMGPGMMQGDRAPATTSSNMPQGGMSKGMMGSGMMQGGMAPSMMCPMMRAMMQGGTGQGMMGPDMMGQSMMGSGTTRGGTGGMFGSRVTPMMTLSVDDVRTYLGAQLERLNNRRLKIGNVSADDGAIGAEIVTVDNSLVQRMKVDRHTGMIEYEN
jgi:hypothetical protein